MADEESKPAIGSDLQKAITNFEKDKLHQTDTKESSTLPDQTTIEAEKKAAQEESGK